jgi:hypothetical protein
MGAFVDQIVYRFAPSWFQARWMRALLDSFAGALDTLDLQLYGGLKAGNPYAAGARDRSGALLQCESDALAYHARDRGISIYSSEPDPSKRYRLSRWRQLKKRRGSHLGELDNLQPFWLATQSSALPTVRIVHQDAEGTPSSVWYTLTSAGAVSVHRRTTSNWNYDGQAAKWSRFWVVLHLPPGYSSMIVYDDGVSVYDGGAVYDGVSALAIRDMVSNIKEAKAAHSRLAGIIATTLQPTDPIPDCAGTHYPFDPLDTAQSLTDGATSLPVGNWGSIIDPYTNQPTRPSWASWLYEDNT